jgi:pimeloyl-ACP methyl ester carboxylesterase
MRPCILSCLPTPPRARPRFWGWRRSRGLYTFGVGIEIVLVPGLLCDATVWESQGRALARFGRLHVADHGKLDSLSGMAEKILGEVSGRFAIAGHSMGGRVAMEVYRAAPERVVGIALMDTGCKPLSPGEEGKREEEGRATLLAKARSEGMRAMARDWVQGMVHASRLSDSVLIEAILDMLEAKTPEIYAAQIRALLTRPDASSVLTSIRCPALVLCGDEDWWAPAQRHREMAAAIPNSTLVDVARCGHMSTMECPREVNAAMRSWLRQVVDFEAGGAGSSSARQRHGGVRS